MLEKVVLFHIKIFFLFSPVFNKFLSEHYIESLRLLKIEIEMSSKYEDSWSAFRSWRLTPMGLAFSQRLSLSSLFAPVLWTHTATFCSQPDPSWRMLELYTRVWSVLEPFWVVYFFLRISVEKKVKSSKLVWVESSQSRYVGAQCENGEF